MAGIPEKVYPFFYTKTA